MKSKPWYSDNDDDNCSCGSCECSSSSEENNHTICYNSRPTPNLSDKNKHARLSINSNRPSSDKNETSEIYRMIDESYPKMSIFYNSIKHTKLDADFLLSINNYFDRLKSNMYKDLIRRETLLRNGKQHARNLISLLRCICQISYEQAVDIPNEFNSAKRATLYTMSAIDYILQCHYPQKKPLFNYILNELIFMWLHESLRIVQEDFSVIVENGTKKNFFELCVCLFHKLESLCAINWERLQMIQNYRLSHFDQLMKPSSIQLEKDQEFSSLFGTPVNSQTKRFEIPLTALYSSRTQNESTYLDEIHQKFRESIAKILREQSRFATDNLDKEDHPLIIPESHARQMITPVSIEMSSVTSTKLVNEHEISSWNLVSKTHTQIPHHSLRDIFKIPKEIEALPTSNPVDEPIPLITPIQEKNSFNEFLSISESVSQPPPSSSVVTPLKSDHHQTTVDQKLNSSVDPQESSSPLTFVSSEQPMSDDHDIVSTKSETVDSKAILNTEVNFLINFLSKLADSSSFIEQENETSRPTKQLESCLKENNTNLHSITEQLRISDPQLSLNTTDPLFLAAFTRALRKELEDSQLLREVDRGQTNDDLQNVGRLSFEIDGILKLPKTEPLSKETNTEREDHNRISIEVIHNPSKCTPHHCERGNSNSINSQLATSNGKGRWYWMRSKDSSLPKDCRITADSLLYARKSFDKSSYSITVEHNEQFL